MSISPVSPTPRCTHSLFEEPWWLDTVAPGAWHEIKVAREGQTLARLPFVTDRRFGLSRLRQPPLTPTLGPWFSPGTGKYTTCLSREHELADQLLSQLPPSDVFAQNFSPFVSNHLPFHWKGFRTAWRCTYRLEDLSNLEAIWKEAADSCRRAIRKAEKRVVIRTDLTASQFCGLLRKTWARQSRKMPYPEELVERIVATSAARKSGQIFAAEDAEGRLHAAILVVWDDRSAYYLLGGGDPDLRESGAHSLLMWHAIRFSAKVARVFDFEGSMQEPIERFFRSFSPRQVAYFRVVKLSRRAEVLGSVHGAACAVSGRSLPWIW